MSGVDLVQWLGEQLDADEQKARAAGGEQWTAPAHVNGPTLATEADPKAAWADLRDGGPLMWGRAVHIAEWDPARVLREIEAKRQLLDDYTVTARIRDEAAARIKAARDHPDPKDLETWDRAQREAAILDGPVKLAASPYDDRPGFREEWRP